MYFASSLIRTAVERLIKFDVWINRRTFVTLGRSKFELSSAHEKFGVWTGPKAFNQECAPSLLDLTDYPITIENFTINNFIQNISSSLN